MNKEAKLKDLALTENIESKILTIRGCKVILDRDLAVLYGVETRRLNEQVKRNIKRFPEDFMFQLSTEEFSAWRSQFAISNSEKMGIRYIPYAFTEHGALMCSNLLKSDKAIEMSILIVRAFVKLREIISTHTELAKKIAEIEKHLDYHDETIIDIIQTLKKLIPAYSDKPKIGFDSSK